MFGTGSFLPHSRSSLLTIRPTSNSTFFSLLFPFQNHKTHFLLFRESLGRNGFRLVAQNIHSRAHNRVVELEDFDGHEEFDFVDEDDEYVGDEDEVEDEDGDDNDIFIPFAKMNAWLENKPRGFGEGKVYDTSIEDKLLEEIEQSRKAQLANINKLKNNPIKAKPKKEQKALEAVPTGICVRVNHLPRKKNIHRDLTSAFKGVPGIVGISPSVSGNKKTKDPICTGLAFVDFKSVEDANRFIHMFSGKKLVFGKIEKQIRCELLNTGNQEYSVGNSHKASHLTFDDTDIKIETDADIDENDPSLNLSAGNNYEEPCDMDDDAGEDFESLALSWQDGDDDAESKMRSAPDSLSSDRRKKRQAVKKKSAMNRKTDNIPTLNIPGAAKRLKVREKAMLADVFTRYGTKVTSSSKGR
ncbi:hypothetical protein Ancab_020558 [Ancistrocladus abbreviatus]